MVDGGGGQQYRSDEEGHHGGEHHPSDSDAAQDECYCHSAGEADGSNWDLLRDGHEGCELAEAGLEDKVAYYPDSVAGLCELAGRFEADVWILPPPSASDDHKRESSISVESLDRNQRI